MTAFRAAFKAYRMHQVLIMPRFARLTIALGLATAVFPVDAEYYFNPRFLSNDLAESVDLSAFTKGREAPPVTVDLPDFPGSAEIPLGVYCSSEQKLSFYLSGATTDSARQVFANTAPDATKASGVGVSLMRNGKILATGENVSLGTVNKSKVPLGLSATYGQTGNKVSAGTVQSVIGVTFIYE